MSGSQFSKKCHIKWHKEEGKITDLHDISQRRYVSGAVHEFILQNELIVDYRKNRTRNICDVCITRIEERLQNEPTKLKPREQQQGSALPVLLMTPTSSATSTMALNEALHIICSSITNGTLEDGQKELLMQNIGKRIRDEFKSYPRRNVDDRPEEIFSDSYATIWTNQPNSYVKSLLHHIPDETSHDQDTARKQMKCIEILHWIVDNRLVSNISLGEAMLLMQFSHSRYAVDLLSKIIPSGSYRTIARTVASLNKSETPIPQNDIIIAFDNNQVVQRTWMIKFRGKQVVSTVTALIFFDQGQNVNHQFTLDIPTACFPTPRNREVLLDRLSQFTENSNRVHRQYRQFFIAALINAVTKDCKKIGDIIADSVSEGVINPSFIKEATDYTRIPSLKREFMVHDLDCININPNSYASLTKILDKLLEYANQRGRKFLPIVMDGSPYLICMRLIKDTYVCTGCMKPVDLKCTEKHRAEHKDESIDFVRKYRKLVIRPGSGHIEMTLVKAILSFFWDQFIKPIATFMGYGSENSLQYAKRGCDHHKSYQLLMVIYTALSHELVYQYVQHCLLKDTTPSLEDFCDWEKTKSANNHTFQMAMDFVFTTLHSLQLFRCGVRMCNDEITLLARHKVASLLYVTNNYKYQEILTADTLYLLSLQPISRKRISLEAAIRPGGTVGEGFDFLLENRNKLYKSFLPTDSSPTFEHWFNVSRTAGELTKLRSNAATRLGMSLQLSDSRTRKLDQEVLEIRKYIRHLGILQQENLSLVSFEEKHVSFEKDALLYLENSAQGQLGYFSSYMKNEKPSLPVMSMSLNEIDFESVTVDQIKQSISTKINALREPLQSFYKSAAKKKKSKEELIEIFKAVQLQRENQLQHDAEEGFLACCMQDLYIAEDDVDEEAYL